MLSLIIPYCDTNELVLVLNANNEEISRLAVECQMANVKNPPRNISDATQKQRAEFYAKGGVYFVTAQVLTLTMNLKFRFDCDI